MNKVFIIIVNWNNSKITLDAINSIIKFTNDEYHIVLVDNGSSDNSLTDFLKLPPQVTLIISEENLGFGTGCNLGIRHALNSNAKYILLLNNDAKLKCDVINYFIKKYQSNKNIGAIAGIIQDNSNENEAHSGYYLNPITLTSHPVIDASVLNHKKYSWITAAMVFIPSEVFSNVGLFDEDFFMYWEDFDLFYRIKQAGYQLEVSKDAVVEHSPGTSSNSNKILRYKWHLLSGITWLKKHHPFYRYSIFILLLRSFLKSILTFNIARFNLTAKISYMYLFCGKINA